MIILFMLERNYSRIAVMLEGLPQNNIKLIITTIHRTSYFLRYLDLLWKLISYRDKNFDLIFIGFFGQPLIPIVKKLTDKPIVIDTFMSTYDTLCFDRKRFNPNSLFGRFFYWLDKYSSELSDIVLLDTNEHIDYFVNTFNLDREKFQRIFVGADDSIFYPREALENSNKFKIFYYSTYLPLHGIEYIIIAAKKLETFEDIEFKIVGKGLESKKIMQLKQELDVRNIEFVDWIPYNELPLEIAKADVCLGGHFSDIDKAKRVISGKTFQFIAMRKPVIIGDNLASKELFENKKTALFVEHANANALANAILELKHDEVLRNKIADGGYKLFKEKCAPKIIGGEIEHIVCDLIR